MDMNVVKDELLKGKEATSQFRRLLGTLIHPTEEERGQCSNTEAKLSCMKNCSITAVDSLENSLSILRQFVESSQIESSSIGQTSSACPSKTRQRTIETPKLSPDGHTWRKYGQKSILNTKHPREYYRCAFKAAQNCQAAKQVQLLSENPPKYRITYIGHHTCQPLLNTNDVLDISMLDYLEQDFTNIISFDRINPTPFPTQEPNVVVPNSSPVTNDHPVLNLPRETYHPSLSKMTHRSSPPTFFDSTTVVESSQFNVMASLNHADEFFSPTMVMSPAYMVCSDVEAAEDHGLMAFDSFDMSGDSLDLPLWDD